jgi:O-antigen/teichoic acid export membrane protein
MLCALAYSGRLSATTALAAIGVSSGISAFGWLWFSRGSFQFSRQRWSYFALKNWVFGRWVLAGHATAVLAANTMPWLIVFWLGPAATGIYAACDAILRFANPIIVSISNLLTPRAAISFNDGGKAALNRVVWQVTTLLSLVLLAFCAVLVFAGEWILHFSFGSNYTGSWSALVVLGVSQLIGKLALAPSRALLVLERPVSNLFAEGAGLLTALIAATLLIPLYGILGAAIAQLTGSLALALVNVSAYLAAIRDGSQKRFFTFDPVTPSPAPIGGATE